MIDRTSNRITAGLGVILNLTHGGFVGTFDMLFFRDMYCIKSALL